MGVLGFCQSTQIMQWHNLWERGMEGGDTESQDPATPVQRAVICKARVPWGPELPSCPLLRGGTYGLSWPPP